MRVQTSPLTRQMTRLEGAWVDFQESFAGLSDAALAQPGVVESWAVRDLIAHIATWEREALAHLPLIANGGRPPRYSTTYGGIDAFNALNETRWRGMSLQEIRTESESTHQNLLEYLRTVPEGLLATGSRFGRRLQLDTYGHYPIHTAHIREWRSRAK